MQRLPGKQTDTLRYFHQGFVYHRDKRNSGTTFRCKHRGKDEECRAVIYVNSLNDLENQPVELEGRHDHAPDHHLPLREKFTEEVLRLALTWEDPKVIFDNTKAKEEYGPIADSLSYYTEYKQKMLKARRENVPPTPTDLVEFGDMLKEYFPLRHLYRGTLRATDNSTGVIMMHEAMLQPLSSAKQLYADGTFKMKARIVGLQQVYIIHFRKLDAGFPAIIVFASSQTTAMYNAIWEKVLEMIPSLSDNVTTITGDFEAAQINSFKTNFPNARVCGCLFHYKAAIVKKWESLKIENCDYILEKAYALAHLPAESIPEGAQHITTLIDREDQANLQTFGAYLRSYWVPLRDVLSVYQNPVRTNNACENFHLHATKRVGVHEPIWKMMTKLSKVIDKTVADYRSLSNGTRHVYWRSLDLQLADVAVHRYELEFQTNRLDVEEFLTVIANLRRLQLSRVFLFDEQQREQQHNNQINVQNQEFLIANLNGAPGAGGFLENELQIRRRRRVHEIVDRQLMPEAPELPVRPRRRPVTARRVDPRPNTAAGEPPVPARRPRGRPPRRPLEVPTQNEGPANHTLPEAAAPEPVLIGQIEQDPQVPTRRSRGRPARRSLEAPIQTGEPANNSEPEAPAPEILEPEPIPVDPIAPAIQVPTRRPRGRPRRQALVVPVRNQFTGPVAPEIAESHEPRVNIADEEIQIEPIIEAIRRQHPSQQPDDPLRIEAVQPQEAERPDVFAVPVVRNSFVEPHAPIEADVPVIPHDQEHGEPTRKKKKTRRGGTQKRCHVCDTRASVQLLRPCRHRLCVSCIRNLIAKYCPFCRGIIESYLPNNMMGGERWDDGVVQDLEREWHEQLLREVMDED